MLLAEVVSMVTEVVFSYLLEQTNLADKLRGYIGRDPEHLAFKTALTRTLNDLTQKYPAWVKDLFDGPFLTGGAAILLARTLQPSATKPTGAELAETWAAQAGLSAITKAKYIDEATTVADYFLTRLDYRLREQKGLWEILAMSDTVATRTHVEQIAFDLTALRIDLTTALTQWQTTTTQSHVTIKNISNSTLTITGPIAGRDLYYTVNQLPPFIRACPVPPAPPTQFGGRNEELNAIIEALNRGINVAVTPTAALTGGGGIGKTTLARAVANEVYRQNAFRAVLWVDLTENPNPTQYLLAWAVLAEPQFEAKNRQPPALAQAVRALLTELITTECDTCEGNRVLVVLDNVWKEGHTTVEALRAAAPLGSTVLLTTRSDEVAIHHNISTRWRLNYLEGDKAIDFLITHLPDASPDSLLVLAQALDGYPLAMELAAVRTKQIAAARGLLIERALAQTTEEYKIGIPADKSFADLHLEKGDTKERNLEKSLAFSYFDLSEDDQRRFRQLGSLPLEMAFDTRLLGYVWEEPDHQKVLDYCDTLCLAALLIPLLDGDGYRQHRLLRAYARALLQQTEEAETVTRRTIDGLLRIGAGLQRKGYNNNALPYFDGALTLATNLSDKANQGTALNNIGMVWSDLGEKRKALEFFQQALPLQQAIGDRGSDATTLTNIGAVWSALGEKRKALEYYEQALPLRKAVGDRGGEATTLNNIGMVWSDLGERHKALEFFQQALPLQQAIGDRGGEATTFNNIGMVWNALGEKRKALQYFEQALSLRKIVGAKRGEATTLTNIGAVWSDLGERYKALEYFEEALPLQQAVGDRSGEAATFNNIGMVWSNLGEKGKALEYFEQALPLRKAVGDRSGEATTLANIGMVWSDLGERHKALEFFQQALPLQQAIGDRGGEATTFNNIGMVWNALGEKRKALEYFEQALSLQQSVSDKAGKAVTLTNIGVVWNVLGNKRKALECFEQALSLHRAVGNKGNQASTLNNIGEVWSSLGEKHKALEYFEQALSLHRAVGNKGNEATTLNNIGAVWSALEEKHKALEYFEQTLSLRKTVGDKSGEATTLNNIGTVWSDLGEKYKALDYFEQALPLLQAVGDKGGEAATFSNIGGVWFSSGDQEKALEYLQRALPLQRTIGDKVGEGLTYFNMGLIQEANKDIEGAITSVRNAITIMQTIGHYSLQQMQEMLERLRKKQVGIVTPTILPQETLQVLAANTVAVCTELPDKRDEWRGKLTAINTQLASAAEWVTTSAFVEALLAFLNKDTPTIPDDNPYAQLLAEIHTAIDRYNKASGK